MFKLRKAALLTTLLALFYCTTRAQNIDSLLRLTKNLQKDTAGVTVLYELGKQYLKTNKHAEAIQTLRQAHSLAKEIGYLYGQAVSLQVMGNYYMTIDRDSIASDYYRQSLLIATQTRNQKLVAANLNQIASISANRGLYIESLGMYKKALAIFSAEKDSLRLTSTLVNLANLYIKMEDSEKALRMLEQAEKTAKGLKENQYVPYISLTVGNVLMNQGYKTEAIGYFDKCAEQARLLKDPYLEAVAISNIASLKTDFDEALRLHLQSIEVFKTLSSKSQVARVTLNIGGLYHTHGDLQKALANFTEAAQLLREIDDHYGLCIVDGEIANTYLKLGQDNKAFEYAKQSLAEARQLKLLKYQFEAYAILHALYLKKGLLKEALAAAERQITLKDSLNSEKNDLALASFKTRLELEKQEQELKTKAEIEQQKVLAKLDQERVLQRARQTRQVLVSVFIGVILLIVVIFSLSLWKRFKVIEAQKKLIESQKDLVEEKQKEILDSIRYAQRIQRALLTSEKYIERNINRLNDGA